MPKLLIPAIIFITLALIFYTIGVWSEHRAGILKKKHVIIFWCGLVCDTLGTYTMSRIVAAGTDKGITPTDLLIHQSTGMLAIILMLIHAVSKTNTAVLKTVLEQIKADGYEFKSLNELPDYQ